MANYIFSVQQMIDIANGGNGNGGATIQGIAGFGVGKGTSSATVLGEAQALNYFLTNGYTLIAVSGYSLMKEYYFTK